MTLGRADRRLHSGTPPAQNPADGAVIWFQLGKDFKGEAKLEILDAKGTVDRQGEPAKLDPKPAEKDDARTMTTMTTSRSAKLEPKPGLNRFVWDLTHDGATVIPGAAGRFRQRRRRASRSRRGRTR